MAHTLPVRGNGVVRVVSLDDDHELFDVRTSKGREGVSVRLAGADMDALIRALITARAGEWLDLLDTVK